MSAVQLELNHIPGTKPHQAIGEALMVCHKLQIQVAIRVEGVCVIIGPNDNYQILIDKFDAAKRRGAKIALVTDRENV